MSGYAVVVRRDGASVTPEELRALMAPLRQRGPHGDATVTQGSFGVASTLLDVGDPRLAPVTAKAGSLVVAGQIRIDARDALVDALRAAGTSASPDDSDVQLFAHAWIRWSDGALSHVLGDFSAVVHDHESRRTTLVRDRFGVRMLYYAVDGERIIVSNTLASVLDAGVSRALDEDAIADYVASGFVEEPARTTYRAVQRVPPAHLLRIHPDGRRELQQYWRLPSDPVDRSRKPDALVSEFRALLETSVRDRTRSSRLTVFMSGGLDSTTLAAIAARQIGDPSRVVARTAHLPTLAPDDDTARAKLAASAIGIPHVLDDVDDYGYCEGTPLVPPDTPEPHDDPDLLGMRDALRRASQHAPVAFWGEDPDAFLAPPHLIDLLRGGIPRLTLDVLAYLLRHRARPHLGVRDLVRARSGAARRADADEGGPLWLRADLRRRRDERVAARMEVQHPTRSDAARQLAPWHWQPFLESLDAGFHGVPIDVRLPYLDVRLIGFALTAPPIPWMQRKLLLREAANGLVPDEIRLAPKRGLPGVYETRAAQWWSRGPVRFEPSEALARFVDVHALPSVDPSSSASEVRAHLRLRILDRWLRARASSA